MAGEYFEWHNLPHELQVAFFEEAEKESRIMAERIGEAAKLLDEAADFIRPHLSRLGTGSHVYSVSAVDGSRSPILSERLGVRYGVFTVGAVLVRELNRLDEILKAGVFKRRQALARDVSKHLFDIITTLAERTVAREMLDRSDLVIIDGSFLGFLYHSLRIQTEDLSDYVKGVVKETFDETMKLIESGRVIAVVKRSPSRAIGGYMVLREGRESPYAYMLDKFLLSFIMPPQTIFYYEDLLGETHPISYYNAVASLSQRRTSIKEIEDKAARDIYAPFIRFGFEKETVRKLSRLQVRPSTNAPSCEIEFPKNIRRDILEEWLGEPNFFNMSTGLPVSLDLVDSLVNIPSRFTDEFVAEVEARTLVRLDGLGADVLKLFFSYLNPQKPL